MYFIRLINSDIFKIFKLPNNEKINIYFHCVFPVSSILLYGWMEPGHIRQWEGD